MSETPVRSVRLAVVQLDDYGPWTVTPAPRRETDLQALQARLYADFADFVGRDDGYAFFGRFDNMLAVANEIPAEAFGRFQERVRNRYPVTISVGIGSGSTPLAAVQTASDLLQAAGSAQDRDRREVLRCDQTLAETETQDITIGHFDIVDATSAYTDDRNAVDAEMAIQRSVIELKAELRGAHESVAQFVGGDNVIGVCPALSVETFREVIDHVEEETGVRYRVGIGRGETAHDAGRDAKHALEVCRESGDRVYEANSTHGSDRIPDPEFADD